jgi:hypothetical protein
MEGTGRRAWDDLNEKPAKLAQAKQARKPAQAAAQKKTLPPSKPAKSR